MRPKPASTIPREIVDCIAHDREPCLREVWSVAERIWREIGNGAKIAIDSTGKPDPRRISFHVARAALTGRR